MNLATWSIRKKGIAFGVSLAFGGLSILGILLYTTSHGQVEFGIKFVSAMIAMGTLAGVVLAWLITKSLVAPLEEAIQLLADQSLKVREEVRTISGMSSELAQASESQSAALQRTSASVEEINAMINKSAESAAQSGKAAKESSEAALQGKQASERVSASIREISVSYGSIMAAVEQSNQRITEITKVISEIGNKTQVINDIVFQTKLLSFNASVEAARAGEHGKGFAVVAEEVGSLAQMSGTAAREISDMLTVSIQKVEAIVTDTRATVERLIAEGKEKIESGSQITTETSQVLQEIVNRVERVDEMLCEISTAASEQAQGVSEITNAMTQLDSGTQRNTGVAQTVASSVQTLSTQATMLRSVLHTIEEIVWGRGNSTSSTTGRGATVRAAELRAA